MLINVDFLLTLAQQYASKELQMLELQNGLNFFLYIWLSMNYKAYEIYEIQYYSTRADAMGHAQQSTRQFSSV